MAKTLVIDRHKLLGKLHDEYKRVEAAFNLHVRKRNCRLDSSGCTDRAKYQERLATLDWLIVQLGGRPNHENGGRGTTIED